jgi:two-component system CitB family sensor kinase
VFRRRETSVGLSRQVFVLHAVIVVLVIGSGVVVGYVVADRLVHRGAEKRVLSVAEAVATMPEVAAALESPDPSAQLQPLAERVRHQSDVSFVVITSPQGIRYSHPDPTKIGKKFIGTFKPAAAGGVVVETFEGTLGPSVRAVVPVRSSGAGEPVIGLVAVGVTVDQVSDDVASVLPLLLGTAAFVLAVAALGSWWISRRLARQTFGMGAAELARVYAHHDAVLHDVGEGLVVVDPDRRVVLINDAAQKLLGVGPEAQGRSVDDLPVTGDLAQLFASGETVQDVVHVAGERLLVVSQVPVGTPSSGPGHRANLGTVLTMRDHTQVKALADELSATRNMAEALRSSAHESANRLHTVVMLARMGDVEAASKLATAEVRATRTLTNRLVRQFDEPTLVALLLGKTAEAAQRSVELIVADDSRLIGDYPEPVDLVTIVGNLLDNAIDAAVDGPMPRRVEVTIRGDDELMIQVRDSGPGFSSEGLDRVFQPGWSTKPDHPDRRHGRGIGMALVQQVATRRGGTVEVANASDRTTNGAENLTGAVVTAHLPLTLTTRGR